jgi:hypothetical protein
MVEFLIFDPNDVFQAAVARMQSDGMATKEVYDELIEEMLEERVELGELSADDDIEEFTESLRSRWSEAEALLTSGHEKLEDDQAS